MTDYLNILRDQGNAQKATEMATYHKADRIYFGVANPVINDLTKSWRQDLTLDARIGAAKTLWDSNVHEARIAAAKLLTQARIRPDDAAWQLITEWVPEFDAWAIADHVCSAGSRRLSMDPTRLDLVETWTNNDHMWTRRAAMVMTLPWTKSNHPNADELLQRDRILGWAATYVTDPDWFIQKSVAWWLRSLSQHDPDRTRAFLDQYGDAMKPFARKDAGRILS